MSDHMTIKAQWEQFEAAVLPECADEVQRRDMRIAFYAGFTSMLWVVNELGDRQYSEEGAVGIIQGLNDEAKAYAAQFQAEAGNDSPRG